MLTATEQISIMKLAKSLARAHTIAATQKAATARMGSPQARLKESIKRAEAKLLDYMKEVG